MGSKWQWKSMVMAVIRREVYFMRMSFVREMDAHIMGGKGVVMDYQMGNTFLGGRAPVRRKSNKGRDKEDVCIAV